MLAKQNRDKGTKTVKISRRSFAAAAGAGAAALASPAMLKPASASMLAHKPDRLPFQVFAALLHEQEPDLKPDGLDPIYLFDRGIWAAGATRLDVPDDRLVKARVDRLPENGSPLVMDFEFFKFRNSREALASRNSLKAIARSFRNASGDRPIGFYEYLPRREFWSAIAGKDSAKYHQWQLKNDFFAELEPYVDTLFPSIYTFHDDPKKWVKYARAQVSEARRISDKPVIPFIWHDFHYNGQDGPLVPIPASFWRLQLETLSEIADGIVIWGGWDPVKRTRVVWDNQADWWLETQNFMRALGRV